jgi:hypothetical protein
LLAGGAVLTVYAYSLIAKPDPLLAILQLFGFLALLLFAFCLFAGGCLLVWKRSATWGPWRCPRCRTTFEAGELFAILGLAEE